MRWPCRRTTPRAPGHALLEAGTRYGIVPYGLDALNTLRIEKGHVTGAELNGNTSADDLGFGPDAEETAAISSAARSRSVPGWSAPDRLQLVGVRPLDPRGDCATACSWFGQAARR